MTDLGTTKRLRLSNRARLAAWESHGGICVVCQHKILAGEAWIVEHVRALELAGEDVPENRAAAHARCGREKTKDDHHRAAKAKRQKLKHIGGWRSRSPLPCGRGSKLKKKITGEVVPR